MPTDESFKARLRASAPAPHDETPQYERFTAVFALVSPAAFVIAAYATYFIFGERLDALSTWLAREFPLLAPRIGFLRAWNVQSARAYAATVTSGALLFSIFLLINAIGYWKTVVRKGGCRTVNINTLVLVVMLLTVFGVLGAIAFLEIPSTWNPSYPGMTRIFFWPTFPMLGGLFSSTMFYGAFSMLVAIVKFVFHRRLSRE